MRLNTSGTRLGQAKNARRPRQFRNLALAGLLLLTACGQSETDRDRDRADSAANPAGFSHNRGGISRVVSTGSFAAVSADEGRAAEVGREILQNGGNATDAAAAMYFALAVTLPSAAGLGSSGACIIQDEKTKAAEAFVFAPIAAPGPVAGQSFTVPSSVRAITLMHIRHGQMRWEQTVAPAERLARFGVPVSRALARDLQASGGVGLPGKGGGMLAEGNNLVQTDLARTLGAIRQRGGGEFFSGAFARTFSEQVSQMGGRLPLEALRSAVPQAGAPASETFGTFSRSRVYVAPSPAAGAMALAGWKGQAPTGPTPTSSNGFSGLVAVDSKGGAAACSLSMGQLFGARLMVPGTGVLLGAPTPEAGSVSPVLIGNPGNGEFTFAGAGGGAPTAPQAVGYVARATVDKDKEIGNVLQQLGGRGGYVNALVCPSGLRSDAASCRSAIDPTGAGLALLAIGR